MSYVAGVDCHKNSHSIVVLSQTGTVALALDIAASAEGYAEAIAAVQPFKPLIWGLEGTGSYGRAFAEALQAAEFDVYEVPGNFTKRHRRHASRHGKSDRNDAQAIAEAALRERDRLSKFEEFDEQEFLRLRYEQRDRLVRERTMLLNRLQSAAFRLGIELPGDLKSAVKVQDLHQRIALMQPGNLVQEALVDEMRFDLAGVERLNFQILRLEGLLRPFVRRLSPELLAMTGVSTTVAAGLIGRTGNLNNLRNADAFAMRAAVAPLSWASGKHHSVRVNTGGDRQLNRLLYIIALVQIRMPNHAGHLYYERKLAQGKSRRAALRALKRRLATVVFYRLRAAQARLTAPCTAAAA